MAFPSTFVDIQNAVIAKLRLDSNADLTKVKDAINLVYADAVVQTEANVTSATMALTSGTASYTLPNGISRIKEMYCTPVGGQQSVPLIQTDLDDILRRRQAAGGVALAVPTQIYRYALLGLSDIELYPTPASADVLTVYYVALPTALSADADTPILPEPYATYILEYGAAAEMADFKSDPQEGEYRQLYEVWKQKLRGHISRKVGMQPGQFRVIPDTPYPPHDPSVDLREYR